MAFPNDFLFGTANADHQVEAHDPDCEDVWDVWERCQGLVPRGRATDFINRYEEDIAAAAAIGCRLFRFSVAWSRVEVADGRFDEAALDTYRNIAACIRRHGMKVMLTLHHFTWPVWLERDCGGMTNSSFPDRFANYAARVAAALGDLVDYWITFNEPSQLTFGYIRPWWHNRYYMPPGLPRGADVDAEARAVGRLIPNLFVAHARARARIKELHPDAKVGANPLVTGFPSWLQMLMDWGACHRGLSEAVFKFTTSGALVREKGDVDLVLAGVSADDQTRFETSDPYLRTHKSAMVAAASPHSSIESLTHHTVGVIAIGNQPTSWKRDLPASARKTLFPSYDDARRALLAGEVDAVYGDAYFLMPPELTDAGKFRLLAAGSGDEAYVAVAPHGHCGLLEMVNLTLEEFVETAWTSSVATVAREARRPMSLHRALGGNGDSDKVLDFGRELKRLRKRQTIRIGIRRDAPGLSPQCPDEGLEIQLARRIARRIFGADGHLEIVPIEPASRLAVLGSRASWLNWVWRFWGTVSLIANVNWWYLGISGRLPGELCPAEALGSLDFVGLDYYWGLPTSRLHKFRALEDAAHGRFLKAPVWPRGLYHALRRFHRWFPGMDMFVVENGSVPQANGVKRADYLRAHLDQVAQALAAGVPVKGYNCWSITSNREWGHAFDPNTDFGLFFVDLDRDPSLRRVPTPDVRVYQEIIRAKSAVCSDESPPAQSHERP
jgi:beta-glucosidase/6-phospho-beta-glucosidase/beta-galactosidase/ABC-type amino acid transport substrate-binding protein